MNPERWRRVKELFQQALERPGDEREAFIDAATADDEELRREVRTLLSSHDSAVDFLDDPPQAAAAEVTKLHDRASRVGERIGQYKILRRIGRGGTGSVYLAVRDDDEFKRRVAIKLVRRGMATADILRRFRGERQILASIDHPFIARLLDGGSTDDGLPYFVMEYIEGEPINVYCDRNRLSVDQRLELFCQVCSAVQVAHQNLVVHRHIKPGNILVSAEGIPKLLDFGIAKLLNPELSAGVQDPTVLEMRVMTPGYASPEQIRGGAITTASDVYSLGVLLYELLTGRRPYHLDNLPMPDIEVVVCTTQPSRPSDALPFTISEAPALESGPHLDAVAIAQARGEVPERLRRSLAGDLDNIVLMALRKEANRRYSSVESFADDVRRHLNGLPVMARADTLGYRAGKFVGRHRLGVAVGATAAFFGLALATTIVVQAGQVAAERDRATRAAERATAVSDFLQEIMASADPIEGVGRDVTVIESVEAAVPRIAASFADQPDLQAAVRHTIGTTFSRLGRLQEAEEQLRAALAIRRESNGASLDTAATLNTLGEVRYDRGDLQGAEQLYQEALETRERLLGREHADVAEVMDNLANIAHEHGNLEQAENMYREVLQIRRLVLAPEHKDIASSLNNLATIHHDREELDDAERLYRESLTLSRVALGNEHPELATSLANLAALLIDRERPEAAEPLLREALAMNRKVLGDRHPGVVNALENLAVLLDERGDYVEARELFLESLRMSRLIWGEGLNVADTLVSLGLVEMSSGNPELAEPYYAEALGLLRRDPEAGPDDLIWVNGAYARCLLELGRYRQSERALLEALQTAESQDEPDVQLISIVAADLVALYEIWGRPAEADSYRVRARDATSAGEVEPGS